MNIRIEKHCKYTIHDDVFTRSCDFSTIEEIQHVISEIDGSEPHIISVDLEERAVDKDDKDNKNGAVLKTESVEKLCFCVVDKLLYPKDVQTIIKKKYNLCHKIDKYDSKIPVVRFSVIKHEQPGMQVNGWPTTQTFHHVYIEQAKPTDIIFNKNLNKQIYGNSYDLRGKIKEMLTKTRGS